MPKARNILTQYECGPFRFTKRDDYDRHLVFDHAVAAESASQRERFEAVARALRDLLTQRWLLTQQTHDHKNPKRVYYLSMEFLLGRVLANNVVNAQLLAVTMDVMKKKRHVDPALVEALAEVERHTSLLRVLGTYRSSGDPV